MAFKYKIYQRSVAGQTLFEDGRVIITDKNIGMYEAAMAAV